MSCLHSGNWTISAHGDEKDGRRTGTKLPTLVPTLRIIQITIHSRTEKNHCRADFFNLKREPGESAAET